MTYILKIRKNMIDDKIVDCIVNLPPKLFLNTQIPASLWFIRKNKAFRKNEILCLNYFIIVWTWNFTHIANSRCSALETGKKSNIIVIYSIFCFLVLKNTNNKTIFYNNG
jgi:type I restriction-modification system DNA methylase subunit